MPTCKVQRVQKVQWCTRRHVNELRICDNQYNKNNCLKTSTPVVRTGVYPTCRSLSPQIVYNTGRHRASGGLFVTRSATVGRVCRTGLTTVKCVIDFSIFDLGGLPRAKGHQKGRRPTTHLDLPCYKISARSRKRSTRYALPKFFTFWLRG